MAKIKICGLVRTVDAEAANRAMPDYVGFVFAKSRRQVLPVQAAQMRVILSPKIRAVGVFVNEDPERIREIVRYCALDLVQLHGQESPEEVERVRDLCGVGVIKAEHAEEAARWDRSQADFLLLDQGAGGTGQSFDWGNIPDLRKPYFLAGGIGLHNLSEALATGAYGVDVSSGAETEGKKDGDKMRRLVERVRKRSENGDE